jgi:hypothetical protein
MSANQTDSIFNPEPLNHTEQGLAANRNRAHLLGRTELGDEKDTPKKRAYGTCNIVQLQ